MAAESAGGVRTRVGELVGETARRLGVGVESNEVEDGGPSLPAALDEFLAMLGPRDGDLGRAWFPSARVGREVLSDGREHMRRTLEIAGLPHDLVGNVAVFLSEPSGAVAWVEMDAGHDPPVHYIHEASTGVSVWSQTFTEWLARVLPNRDGELPPWM